MALQNVKIANEDVQLIFPVLKMNSATFNALHFFEIEQVLRVLQKEYTF